MSSHLILLVKRTRQMIGPRCVALELHREAV
jgi:hypothetical protein